MFQPTAQYLHQMAAFIASYGIVVALHYIVGFILLVVIYVKILRRIKKMRKVHGMCSFSLTSSPKICTPSPFFFFSLSFLSLSLTNTTHPLSLSPLHPSLSIIFLSCSFPPVQNRTDQHIIFMVPLKHSLSEVSLRPREGSSFFFLFLLSLDFSVSFNYFISSGTLANTILYAFFQIC